MLILKTSSLNSSGKRKATMKKTSVVILMLLLCAIWALAQQGSSHSDKSGSQTSVEGCLSRSGSNYTLTDKSGTTYQLTGDTSKLADHVGHEIQITGTESTASSAPSASSSSSQPTFDVTSMKHISETCSSESKSKPESQKPPMSEKPPR